MGRVEEAVRSAIVRTVRRELRSTLAPVSKEVRELRQSVSQLERAVASLKQAARQAPAVGGGPLPRIEVTENEVRRARISPALIKKLRARLGITQAELAALVGVTGPAVAQWEGGSSEPRGENRAIVVGLRKLGRRDVQVLLESRGMGARRIQRGRREAARKGKK